MKRSRSWGDRELLGNNTEDNTDTSEQDESLSSRSSWSLVSHSDNQSQLQLEGPVQLYCLLCDVSLVGK